MVDTVNYNMGKHDEHEEHHELPWLIFTLCDNAYAVNSNYVNGILPPPPTVSMPYAPDIYKGLADIRGETVPLLYTRKLFGLSNIEEECLEFDTVLEFAKTNIEGWIAELKKFAVSTENGEFAYSTDCEKSEFGKWYRGYINHHNTGYKLLERIDDTNKLMHEAATETLNLLKETPNQNTAKINELLNKTEKHAEMIIWNLDEAKRFHRDSYRETVVSMSNGEKVIIALLVDSVLGVDKISRISDSDGIRQIAASPYFVGVAHNDKIDKEILIIDENLLLNKAKVSGN